MENDDDYEIGQDIKIHENIVWASNYDQGKKIMVSVGSDMTVVVCKRNEDSMKFNLIHRI